MVFITLLYNTTSIYKYRIAAEIQEHLDKSTADMIKSIMDSTKISS